MLCVYVEREIMCGGGGPFLGNLSPRRRMHVALPWVNPPRVCVCVCACADWVSKSFVAESSLNKGSF